MIIALVAGCAAERSYPLEPSSGVHPRGMLDPSSEDFHGKDLARRGYDLALCASCHGDDFAGGSAHVSCTNCHPAGPDACATCHRSGPTSGAHVQHRAAGQTCGECHVVPARWDDPGHILRDPAPAEVNFGALAAQPTPDRKGPPSYAEGRCANVYCHGDALRAGGGSDTMPRWEDPKPTGGCTKCHGAPPPSHAQSACATCHRDGLHLDGKLDVGGDCNSCHRSSPVFADLSGATSPTAITVGAHQAHVTGAARLRGPISCNECHRMPATVTEVGHLDSLLPAEVEFGSLSRADNAVPQWNRATATCSGTYCHGGGIWLSSDPVAGVVRTPSWTATSGQVFCGSCHGVPPTTHGAMTLAQCAGCHPSVDGTGTPIVNGSTSQHMDGVVDVTFE